MATDNTEAKGNSEDDVDATQSAQVVVVSEKKGFIKEILVGITGGTLLIICAVIALIACICVGSIFFSGGTNFGNTNSQITPTTHVAPTIYIDPEVEKDKKIDDCIQAAYESYLDYWIDTCKLRKIEIRKDENGKDTCTLDSSTATEFNRQRTLAEELCISRYK